MSEYIERKAAVGKLMPIYKSASLRNRNVFSTARKCLEAVENIPAADVAPVRHGRWGDMGDFIYCSICNVARMKEFLSDYGVATRLDVRTNYCPHCGAKMDGDESDGHD